MSDYKRIRALGLEVEEMNFSTILYEPKQVVRADELERALDDKENPANKFIRPAVEALESVMAKAKGAPLEVPKSGNQLPKEDTVESGVYTVFKASDFEFTILKDDRTFNQQAADTANRILRERSQVVTGHNDGESGAVSWWQDTDSKLCAHSYRALLIAIEPIVRDSAEAIAKDLARLADAVSGIQYKEYGPTISKGESVFDLIDRAKALIGMGE